MRVVNCSKLALFPHTSSGYHIRNVGSYLFFNLQALILNISLLLKDSAYFCYCTNLLRISEILGFPMGGAY